MGGFGYIKYLKDAIDALNNITATNVWELDISGYAGAGYAGTYIKTVYDDWLNGGRLDLILDAIAAEVNADALAQGDGSVVSNVGVDSLVRAIADIARAGGSGDLAAIKGLVDSAEVAGPYSYLDAGLEQDVYEDAAVTRRRIWLEVSNRNMTQTGTFRVYRKVNGANYDLYTSQAVKVVAGSDRAWDVEFTTNQAWKITYEEDVDEGAARAIPYNVITQVIE